MPATMNWRNVCSSAKGASWKSTRRVDTGTSDLCQLRAVDAQVRCERRRGRAPHRDLGVAAKGDVDLARGCRAGSLVHAARARPARLVERDARALAAIESRDPRGRAGRIVGIDHRAEDVALVDERHAPAAVGRIEPVPGEVDLVERARLDIRLDGPRALRARELPRRRDALGVIHREAHRAHVVGARDPPTRPGVLLQHPDPAQAAARALRGVPRGAAAGVVGVPDREDLVAAVEELEAVPGAGGIPPMTLAEGRAFLDAGGGGEEGCEEGCEKQDEASGKHCLLLLEGWCALLGRSPCRDAPLSNLANLGYHLRAGKNPATTVSLARE
jgi:hypothetical protein